MTRIIAAFLRKDVLEFASYRLYMILVLWGMALMFGHFIFLGRVVGPGAAGQLAAYGGNYFTFAVLGIAFAQYFDFALNGLASQIRQGQTVGTLEALFVTRTPAGAILTGMVSFQFIYTMLLAAVYIAAAVVVAGLAISLQTVIATLLLLVLTLFSFLGFGMLSASFIMVFKRGEPVAWFFQGLSYLLSGVYYPVTVLPDWMQALAQLLPLTHAMEAVRRLWLQQASLADIAPQLAWLAAFGVVFIPVGIWSFRWALAKARREGTLAQF